MQKARKHSGRILVSGSLTVAIFKEGRTFVASAPTLDLVAQGRNIADAQKNFEEVFDIYVEETTSKGTLEKDLLRCGWQKRAGSIQPPTVGKFSAPEKMGKDIELTALMILPLSAKKFSCPA